MASAAPKQLRNSHFRSPSAIRALQAKALEAQIDREEGAVIQKLLGIPWNGIEDYLGRNAAGYLSLHKAGQVQQLKNEFEAAKKRIEAGAPDRELTSAEEKSLNELGKSFEKNLAALLTAEEMQEYRLHHSHDSAVLRRNLLGVDVTEQEFREMYQRRQELNDLIAAESSQYASDDSARERVSQGIKGFEEGLAEILGPERYADYQRGEDNAYQRLRQYADAVGVPETEANVIYEYKREIEAVNRARELSPEERAKTVRALRGEAAAAAEQKLGGEAYQVYLRRGGDWLKGRD